MLLLLLLVVLLLLLEVVSGAARVCWNGWQGLEHVLTPPPLPAAPHANSLVEMDTISGGLGLGLGVRNRIRLCSERYTVTKYIK